MFELLIVGLGPAGLTSGIYAARYGLKTAVVGRDYGLIGEAPLVENYPGFKSIAGLELAEKLLEHVKAYNVPVRLGEEISQIAKKDEGFIAETSLGEEVEAYSIIYAAGAEHRKLGIPGEDRLSGRGVSYCAACDAFFYKGRRVAVIGGSDSAALSALILSQHARKVYILYRRSLLRCEHILAEKIAENPRIETVYDIVPVGISGDESVEAIVLTKSNGKRLELGVDGVFVEIGTVPNVEPLLGLGVQLDEGRRIVVSHDMSANVKGFFAAGNVTTGSNKLDQIVTAASEGAIAASSSYHYLKGGSREL